MHERITRPLPRFLQRPALWAVALALSLLFLSPPSARASWGSGGNPVQNTISEACQYSGNSLIAPNLVGWLGAYYNFLNITPYTSGSGQLSCNFYVFVSPSDQGYRAYLWVPICGSGFTADDETASGCSPTNAVQPPMLIGNDTCSCQALPSQGQAPAGPLQFVSLGGGGQSGGALLDSTPNGTGGISAGEPIDIASGNVTYHFTDYTTAGQNPLGLTRYYNSRTNFSGMLGAQWQTNFDRYVYLTSSTNVTAVRPNGQQLAFNLVSGVWTPDSDVDYTLTLSGSTWMLTAPDDTVETYSNSASGFVALLNSIKSRNGYTQTLTYSTSGSQQELASVSDSYSRSLTFTYNTDGTLASVSTPDSTTISYGYTSGTEGPQLTSVTYPTSPASTVTYAYGYSTVPTALTSITDENGHTFATWTYDAYGRGLTSALGGSSLNATLTTLAYNDTTGSRTVSNALGVTDTYSFSILVNVPKVTGISRASTSTTAAATESFSYDTNGYLSSITDWKGNLTNYTNNSHGLPTQVVEAYGSSVARTTTITYDTTFVHLPHSIATPGLTTSFTYQSGTGNVLTKTLTDTTTDSTPYSTNGQTRTWTYTWTSSNTLLNTINTPNNNTTTLAYNSGGALTSITDALSHVTNMTSVTGGGRPLTIVDPNSVTTTLTYSPRQWLLTRSVSTSGGARTTTYTYDAAGNLTKTTLPDSSYLANTFDNAHRVAQVTDALGNYISYTLDALGDRTQESTYDSGSTQRKNRTRTFDALGRALTDTGATSETATYTWDKNGNQLTAQDGNSHTTTNAYDALNRLHTVTDALSHVTTYAYDAHDQLSSLTDPNSNATTWTRDGFSEAIQEVSPDRGTTVYHFDGDGNLTQKVDASSHTMNQTFDALDRPLTTTYPADSTLNVSYTYDQTTGHGKGIGRLTSLTDQAGSLSRSYDELANLLTDARSIGTTNLTTTYTYDPASRIASITYPAGTLVAYSHDAQGNVSNVAVTAPGSSTAVNLASSITHMPFGPMKGYSTFNSLTVAYTLDQDYRITNLSDGTSTALTWDNAHNVTAITDWGIPGTNRYFTFDNINRLTYADARGCCFGTESFSYDANGNMTANGGTTFTYSTSSNRMTQASWTDPTWGPQTETFSYTATGNMTNIALGSYQLYTLTYNAANRTATTNNGSTAYTLSYDYKGQRAIRTCCASPSTYFTYNQGQTLLEEVNNGFYVDYIYLDDRLIGLQENKSSGSPPVITTALYYVNTNYLGTAVGASDSTGTSVYGFQHYPYGQQDGLGGSITENLRLPGMYWDDAYGFLYNIQRDYNSDWGRYFQVDPIGLAGGTNPYVYVGDNPVTNVDPLGLAGSIDGPPGQWVQTSPTQWRYYDMNGNASVDLDCPHGHNPYPHAHNWENGRRGEGVPYSPLR
jgi:RHS repeat-associated protein